MSACKYIRPEVFEAIACKTLEKYDPMLMNRPSNLPVPIEDIIESMGLSLEYQYIRKNGRILGETVFDDSYIPLYNMERHEYELVFVSRGTILLDASLLQNRKDGRLRFTAAHELAHWLIHQKLYAGTGNTAAMLQSVSKSSAEDETTERQADMLASALLMPMGLVKQQFYRMTGKDRISEMADRFGVSRQAMEIRLRKHRLI